MASDMPDQALDRLMRGNRRFVADWPDRPNQSVRRRRQLAKEGQQPFAVIVTCADSRVPPEIIFDAGLGDLFVVRVAGNVLDDVVIGSIEYAVEHLHVPLVMILGHDGCGAVTAALNRTGQPQGRLGAIMHALQPAVELAEAHCGDVVSHAIDANVRLAVKQLKAGEQTLSEAAAQGKISIAGARYHLESGVVDLLD
jgi:carbonic anhydrase